MPCTFTHAVFSEQIYKQIKDKSNLEDLKSFSQGPDSFNFYNLISVFPSKKYRKLSAYTQNKKTKEFFINLIKYIKNNKLETNKQVMSFLYGFICHYFLDKTTHPYIIYKSGEFNIKDKSTYKYNNNHHEIEVYIDCYLINKIKKTDHTKFKIHEFCFNKNDFSNELKKTIDYVFYKTYKFKYVSKVYEKSLNQMKFFYKYFRYDETKIKRYIYSFIDFLTPIQIPKIKISSYNIKLNKQNYLNKNKNFWNHPTNKKEQYNYSFEELYLISKKDCLKAIKEVNKVLYENKNITTLNKVFLNLSYKTNKNCNLKLKTKYFEH
jgi:hypothetical protein